MMQSDEHLDAIRRSLSVLVLILLFVVTYFAKELLFPILIGFLIALTLSPVSRALGRIGIAPPISAVMMIVLLAVGIVASVYFSSDTVAQWVADSDRFAREIKFRLSDIAEEFEDIRAASEEMTEVANGDDSAPDEVMVQQPTIFSSALSILAKFGASIAVSLVLATFLLASGDMFYVKLVQSFDTFAEKKRALRMVYDIERRVSRYLLTITLINAALGLSIFVVLSLIGLEYAYIWGIAGFLLNFLPYLGGLIGTVLVGLYAIITFDSVGYALLVPLAYQTLTAIEGQFVTPWLVGRSLELNTVAVFLTVVLWGWLWGVAGALVAVPFLVVFKVICDNVDRLKIIGNFLGHADPLSSSDRAAATSAAD